MANWPHPSKGSKHNANSGYKPGIRRLLREDRQIQAKVRQGVYDKLTPEVKLAELDALHLDAKRQRAKLKAIIAEKVVGAPAPKKAHQEKAEAVVYASKAQERRAKAGKGVRS
jgi:hypothetical protein